MYDRPDEFENRPIGMVTLVNQEIEEGFLKAPTARENLDQFTEMQSFTDETGYLHQDLQKPLFGCC